MEQLIISLLRDIAFGVILYLAYSKVTTILAIRRICSTVEGITEVLKLWITR